MSIFIDEHTKVVVQGLTGGQGRFHALRNRAYGTKVVAGVRAGKGGQDVEGIPVYDTVAEAKATTGANASFVSVPPAGAPDAILEAAKHAPHKHLVDLAIVASALDMDGSLVEYREVMAARALTRAVLGLAHVPESSCDLQALYERHERECVQNVNS